MSDFLKAIDTNNPYIIATAIFVIFIIPTFKIFDEIRKSSYTFKKDRQIAFFSAIFDYLKDPREKPSGLVNYQIEQTFTSYYNKKITHNEIRYLLSQEDPSRSINLYLGTIPYLYLRTKNNIPHRPKLKSKINKTNFHLSRKKITICWPIFKAYALYSTLGTSGGLILAWIMPMAIKTGSHFIIGWVLFMSLLLIISALIILKEGMNQDSAIKYIAKRHKPYK